jgi:hypothetical protein
MLLYYIWYVCYFCCCCKGGNPVFQKFLSRGCTECKIINSCRMSLRAHSIADLTLAGGKHIDSSFLALDPSLLLSASALVKPLQDPPQTASALRIWQQANRLWCNTVTGGLHQPLGKWLVPGPKLRRSWPFYFDWNTNTLWSRTGEGFSAHSGMQSGDNLKNTRFHFQMNRQSTTLPSNSFPVECRETMTRSVSTFLDQVPMIPGVSAQLWIDGKTIVSKHRVIAWDIRRTKAIKLRIREKMGMTDQAFNEVDWDSHTMAVGQSQLSQPFLVKLLHQNLHNWLPHLSGTPWDIWSSLSV